MEFEIAIEGHNVCGLQRLTTRHQNVTVKYLFFSLFLLIDCVDARAREKGNEHNFIVSPIVYVYQSIQPLWRSTSIGKVNYSHIFFSASPVIKEMEFKFNYLN